MFRRTRTRRPSTILEYQLAAVAAFPKQGERAEVHNDGLHTDRGDGTERETRRE